MSTSAAAATFLPHILALRATTTTSSPANYSLLHPLVSDLQMQLAPTALPPPPLLPPHPQAAIALSLDRNTGGERGCQRENSGTAATLASTSTVKSSVPSSSRQIYEKDFKKQKKINCQRYPLPEKPRQKRAVIQDMVRPLKQWLLRHRHNPYPTKAEKAELALGSNMTLVQVSNWFANARRRLKNVVQDPRCSWSRRLRMYNQFVQGNAELLSIASDDSIWNSNDEDEDEENDDGDRKDKEEEEDDIDVVDCSDEEAKAVRSLQNDNKYKKSMMQRFLSDSYQHQQEQQQHSHSKTTKETELARKRKREPEDEREYMGINSKRIKLGSVAQPKAVFHRPFASSPAAAQPPPPPMLLPLPLLPPLSLLPPPLLAMRAMASLPPPPPAASQPLPSTLKLLSELSAFSLPASGNDGRRVQDNPNLGKQPSSQTND